MRNFLPSRLALATLTSLALLAAPAMAQTPQPATTPGKPAATAPAKPAAAPATTAKPAEKKELLDINSASQADLEALKGIGKVRAEAIIKGRPYKGKDELVQKKIIPENVYKDIKDLIIAKQK